MAAPAVTERTRQTTFRDVFGVRDWRALWFAQLLSITGDQFARVAVTVLVYDRTGSALLASLAFAASVVPVFIGGLTLGWIADRYPRRTVMICCDLASLVLVLAMAVPGLPLAALVVLLAAVTLVFSPFMAARAATNREVLGRDRFEMGNAVTLTTYQAGQLAGFALGGALVGVAGARPALLIDAATFAVSALLVTLWLTPRPAPQRAPEDGDDAAAAPAARFQGARLVSGNPAARTAALLAFLVMFFDIPEGVPAPLARQLGGGAAATGLILAAGAAGAAAGFLVFGRLVPPRVRTRLTPALAVAACALLIPFAWQPGLAVSLLLLAGSGFCACYIVASNRVFFNAIPDEHRGKAGGVIDAGMSSGQALVIVAGGALAGRIGAAHAIALAGAIGVAAAVLPGAAWIRLIRSGRI